MLLSFTVLIGVAALILDASNAHLIILYQLLGGGLLYGAVYMVTDPVTAPTTKPGRWLYGLLIGSLVATLDCLGQTQKG